MKAHLVQVDSAWEDHAASFARVDRLLGGARVERGDLVLLPEMFSTGFSLNTQVTTDRAGLVLSTLSRLARRLGAWVQGGRAVQEPGDKLALNEMTVVNPSGAVVCRYHKIHPFSFGREPERFVGGTEVVTWRWEEAGLTVCPAVCYDLRFPELFRRGLSMGAECLAIGACWPKARQEHWRALLVARAIENQAIVLGVNRTGHEPTLEYAGGSIALGPRGEILGELGAEEAVLSVEVDAGAVRQWRDTFPAWRDRRLGT